MRHGITPAESTKELRLQNCVGTVFGVRPEGAYHLWREVPPGELSIDPVADERLGWATGRVEAS